MVSSELFSQVGFDVEAKGTLVTLVTNEDVGKSYRGEYLDMDLKLPIVLIADHHNTVTPLISKGEFNGKERDFREQIIETLKHFPGPFYGFYGEFYKNVIYVASGLTYRPEFVDLRKLCCKGLLDIHDPNVIKSASRSHVMSSLRLPSTRIRNITGDVAIKAFGSLERKFNGIDFDTVYAFAMNAMYNDIKMLYKCYAEGLLTNERTA